jgi:hypothetical protein
MKNQFTLGFAVGGHLKFYPAEVSITATLSDLVLSIDS